MTPNETSVLVIGYGNPARGDDGLGPLCAEAIEALDLPGVRVQTDYQLQVEDATAIADHDVVIFIDADAASSAPFSFDAVEPDGDGTVSSHRISAGTLLALARGLFGATAKAYMLGIRGVEFAPFTERLSAEARSNLTNALRFIEPFLRRPMESPNLTGGVPCLPEG